MRSRGVVPASVICRDRRSFLNSMVGTSSINASERRLQQQQGTQQSEYALCYHNRTISHGHRESKSNANIKRGQVQSAFRQAAL